MRSNVCSKSEDTMTREEIIEKGQVVYKKPTLLNDTPMHYCPGCSHGVVHKIVSEVIEKMGMTDKTIAISPVGCAVFAYNYIDVDWIEAAHGRACAVATAVKRLHPENLVFTYQGDGDLSAIGTGETIHAAARGAGAAGAGCPGDRARHCRAFSCPGGACTARRSLNGRRPLSGDCLQ